MQSVHPIRSEATGPPPSVEEQLALAFAPLHKLAFGAGIGAATGIVVVMVTVAQLLLRPSPAPDLTLLRHYFYGYDVTWPGAVIGGFWGFVAGFVAGWFVAFCRNFVVAVSVFVTRARAELQQTRDFLDHI